jgi:hypothetical protein
MTDKTREAFEAFLNPGNHAGNLSPWVEPGRYEKETHQLAWLAWQAATARALAEAVKTCEGKKYTPRRSSSLDAWQRSNNIACNDCIAAIKEALK